MKVFIDTNIMIDFLENRQPFADDAIRIFELSALGKASFFSHPQIHPAQTVLDDYSWLCLTTVDMPYSISFDYSLLRAWSFEL